MGMDEFNVDDFVLGLLCDGKLFYIVLVGFCIGYVYMWVGDIVLVCDFYVKVIGFDMMVLIVNESVVFFLNGCYYYYVGFNVW